jgi:hypothetical protein
MIGTCPCPSSLFSVCRRSIQEWGALRGARYRAFPSPSKCSKLLPGLLAGALFPASLVGRVGSLPLSNSPLLLHVHLDISLSGCDGVETSSPRSVSFSWGMAMYAMPTVGDYGRVCFLPLGFRLLWPMSFPLEVVRGAAPRRGAPGGHCTIGSSGWAHRILQMPHLTTPVACCGFFRLMTPVPCVLLHIGGTIHAWIVPFLLVALR